MKDKIKSFIRSKTFWVNTLAFLAFILQGFLGKEVLPAEMQAAVLAFINVILRFITDEPISWSLEDKEN